MTTITNYRELLEEVVEIFDSAISARYPHQILSDIRAALAAPATAPATAPELSQHDDLDKVATARYKVVKSRSTIWPCSVVAGDGEQELFSGSESTCKHVARKLTGAFLDGAFYSQSTATLQSATAPECKTSGGDTRAVALARLLDQAYERGVAVGLSQAVPATAPEPVAWINGHDLRLLGRQGRGALVWCDNEGNADTPIYLHPPATAPEQPAWHDAPTCAGVWLSDRGYENPYRWGTYNVVDPAHEKGMTLEDERWFGPIPEDKP